MFKEDKGDPRNKGYGFSPADFALAATAEVAEIHAISAGYSHTLGPPKEGWNKRWLERKGAPTFQKHYRQTYRELINGIVFKGMDAKVADRDLWHIVMTKTAKELGMKYSRTEVKGDSLAHPTLLDSSMSDLLDLGLSSSYLESFSLIRSDKKCGASGIPDNAVCRIGVTATTFESSTGFAKDVSPALEIAKERRRKKRGIVIGAGILGLYTYHNFKSAERLRKGASSSESNWQESSRIKSAPDEVSNWHRILGVSKNASSQEIKQAYKKKAREFHPDINKSPDAANMMQEINAAHEYVQYKKKFGKFKKDSVSYLELRSAYRDAQRWHPEVSTDFWAL
jgi:hypothetical protein